MEYGIERARKENRLVEYRPLPMDVVMDLAKRFAMVVCDGCNVQAPFEHRCHEDRVFVNGVKKPLKTCECPVCKEAGRIVRGED